MTIFRGIFAPATTPFDADTGEIDIAGLRRNVAAFATTDLTGLVLFGTTGEGLLLDESECLSALTAAREVVGDKRILAAVGAESTRVTIQRARAAAAAGAEGILVAPPSYYRPQMTHAALRRHYEAVADGSPIPIVLYQVPRAYAVVELGIELVAELAGHGNVAGIKDSAGDLALLSQLVAAVAPADFGVLVGSGGILHGALKAGAVGGILAVADLDPGACCEVWRLHNAGDDVAAASVQARLTALHTGIVGAFGVAGMKYAVDLVGQVGGPPRSPLLPLDEAQRAGVARVLAAAELLQADAHSSVPVA